MATSLLGACSGSDDDASEGDDGAPETTGVVTPTIVERPPPTSGPQSPPPSLPAGAVAGLDDYNGDGEPDPTCGIQDFGAGLGLRIPCSISSAHEPPEGTTLVSGSLFRLPGENPDALEDLSGDLIQARDTSGAKVSVIVFNTDALFDTGSSTLRGTELWDATVRAVNRLFPDGTVQVRGHTDATGTAAANRTLSEQRAARVRDYLRSNGLEAGNLTAVGLGSTQPLAEEQNRDGSPNDEGRRFNRRVEIAVRQG